MTAAAALSSDMQCRCITNCMSEEGPGTVGAELGATGPRDPSSMSLDSRHPHVLDPNTSKCLTPLHPRPCFARQWRVFRVN